MAGPVRARVEWCPERAQRVEGPASSSSNHSSERHLARLSMTMSSSSSALGLHLAVCRQHVLCGPHGRCRISSSLAPSWPWCQAHRRSDPSRSRLQGRMPNHGLRNRSRAAVETLERGEEGRSHLE
jgi:hypothetical protein